MILQKTLKKPVEISGVGLHSGKTVNMQLLPAPANHGITFVRSDLKPAKRFRACPTLVTDTRLCTVISQGGASVATIEHIMAALAGLGVDNVEIVVDAPEIPIVDGSSAPFVYAIQHVGLSTQDAEKQFIFIKRDVEVRVEDKWAKLSPYSRGFKIDFAIDFTHPAIRKTNNRISLNLTSQQFVQSLSRARTFGFLRDSEYLRENNLALGGSLENAVVLDEYRVLNEQGLRYEDEFVRHKALDAVGDLYVSGYAIVGHYMGYKSGHALNNELFRALLADSRAYEIRGFTEAEVGALSQTGLQTGELPATGWVF
ncbi:UDP-3-O-acyl-N-acetylglucosamine deacetylase [Ostreibacterium oceani]|uniref:UDP-3-O-acyl-N-acetylglucosamine deacetylase n=1 Tax=Ostreibacterium oceani TaxID=2654998 RepID=A0A6N7EY15_9GAMM|nr:UDP-3-O-acyl-N-acetylglucosamine deacetylase [Ostreibacterium oceani]MPV86279.1 UDP-3-O-acyl-N-acetylglucosamine deacetylase [Ostreibacterium oceani]